MHHFFEISFSEKFSIRLLPQSFQGVNPIQALDMVGFAVVAGLEKILEKLVGGPYEFTATDNARVGEVAGFVFESFGSGEFEVFPALFIQNSIVYRAPLFLVHRPGFVYKPAVAAQTLLLIGHTELLQPQIQGEKMVIVA